MSLRTIQPTQIQQIDSYIYPPKSQKSNKYLGITLQKKPLTRSCHIYYQTFSDRVKQETFVDQNSILKQIKKIDIQEEYQIVLKLIYQLLFIKQEKILVNKEVSYPALFSGTVFDTRFKDTKNIQIIFRIDVFSKNHIFVHFPDDEVNGSFKKYHSAIYFGKRVKIFARLDTHRFENIYEAGSLKVVNCNEARYLKLLNELAQKSTSSLKFSKVYQIIFYQDSSQIENFYSHMVIIMKSYQFDLNQLFGQLNEENTLPKHICLRFAKELLAAVNFMHKQKLIHRDIKLENIFISGIRITEKGKFDWKNSHIALADFGSVCRNKTTTITMGTLENLELQYYEQEEKEAYQNSSQDIWSTAIVIWELLFNEGFIPYNVIGNEETFVAKTAPDKVALMKLTIDNVYQTLSKSQHPLALFFYRAFDPDIETRATALELLHLLENIDASSQKTFKQEFHEIIKEIIGN